MSENVKGAKELVREYMAEDIPVWVEGKPGVGKSSMFEQLAQEKKIGFKDLRLAQMDPVDLRGLPTTHAVQEAKQSIIESIWARPDFWPRVERDGPKGILLFDELSDCGRAMQSASYQIIQNRRAGPHEIPPGWYPVAAGNRREDKAAAQHISTALATRFAWITLEPDTDVWLEYAHGKQLHHFVTGYLKAFPKHLWSDEGAESKTFACPRQWERVASIADRPPHVRYRLVAGLIGTGIAGQFEAAIKSFNLPDLDDVLKAPKKCRIPKQPAEKYALASMLAYNATQKNFDKIMQYVERPEFGRDFWISMVLSATDRDADLSDTEAFARFANQNSALQIG